jgi:hypothetical protein
MTMTPRPHGMRERRSFSSRFARRRLAPLDVLYFASIGFIIGGFVGVAIA